MWTEKQQEAIDKRNCNILVAASAGSGKTAVLVERVITRVISDGVDINKLLIVTFTNASASELKEDSKYAQSGGATGVILFRYGLINFFNFNSL